MSELIMSSEPDNCLLLGDIGDTSNMDISLDNSDVCKNNYEPSPKVFSERKKVCNVDMEQCKVCYKLYSNKSNLYKHLKSHGITRQMNDLCETLEFDSMTDFLTWKGIMERDTCSSFIKRRGQVRAPNDDIYMYYDCCRSGVYKPKGKGIRKMKLQRTAKIGTNCSAKIRIKITEHKIYVQFYNVHDKHDIELEHLRIPPAVRHSIADNLKRGISAEAILNCLRTSATDVERSLLVDYQDIHNIRRDFNISNLTIRNQAAASQSSSNTPEESVVGESSSHHLSTLPTDFTNHGDSSENELSSSITEKIETILELNEKHVLTNEVYEKVHKMLDRIINIFSTSNC